MKTRSKRNCKKLKGSIKAKNGKWSSYIVYNKETIKLGEFYSEEAAARAYDEAALYYRKSLANTNFTYTEEEIYYFKHKKPQMHRKRKKYTGVSYNTFTQKWDASIRDGEYKYHLGSFLTAEEAAHAYDKKAKELGRSYTNF